jgi:hypothetical protein
MGKTASPAPSYQTEVIPIWAFKTVASRGRHSLRLTVGKMSGQNNLLVGRRLFKDFLAGHG